MGEWMSGWVDAWTGETHSAVTAGGVGVGFNGIESRLNSRQIDSVGAWLLWDG